MIRIRQIKVPFNEDISKLKSIVSSFLNIPISDIKNIKIHKESLDARKKPELYFVYEVDIDVLNEEKILKRKNPNILKTPNEKYEFKMTGTKTLNHRPIIIGSGPAGMFCGLLLAENGYNPIIVERGEAVDERYQTVLNFWQTGKLNTKSNVQFGEGGAGTFSDGKLTTQIKDSKFRINKVLDTFVMFGATKEITYQNKPHIGTDLLINVVKNMRNKIIELGGTFMYNSCFNDMAFQDNKIAKVKINDTWFDTDILVLAIGHSARDTFQMLYDKNILMESKPFAVGVRVMHNQSVINESQYGIKKSSRLGEASYKLTYKAKSGRGVYSFCMCPGGYVVNASSENNRLAINGMSNHNRDSGIANSAIIVTINQNDFGTHPLDGIKFQRYLEEKAYKIGNGNIPLQLLKDYKENIVSSGFKSIKPQVKGHFTFSNINDIFPYEINRDIKESMDAFNQKIKHFNDDDVILAAIESRTSSPVRIIRGDSFESNIEGIFPCGEGAGYAGGITSAAVDGIKVAEKIAEIYKS